MPSVHDNTLIAYAVHGKNRTITLQTEYPHTDPAELTDVIFEDVLAYHFQHDLMGNIIFDIEEVDLASCLHDNQALFEAGQQWGWPLGWEPQKESMECYARRMGLRAFELSASYGMTGWVLAKTMTKVRKA